MILIIFKHCGQIPCQNQQRTAAVAMLMPDEPFRPGRPPRNRPRAKRAMCHSLRNLAVLASAVVQGKRRECGPRQVQRKRREMKWRAGET